MNRYVRPNSLLQVLQQVQRSGRWMETSSALTGSSQHDELGLERQGAGDADALALTAENSCG